ncbi:unnamed protein product [Lupinus luteus]|uniref:non-specific serine/threonine protein kinase n=1 Tax=Lupinus luteus TaxID=3873 RepID=A0AAV1VQK4_LUPLU
MGAWKTSLWDLMMSKNEQMGLLVPFLTPNTWRILPELLYMYISSIQHENLVILLGYCQENNLQFLVYAYVTNGCLSRHLYGLAHLYSLSPCFLHKNFKTANVLMDENFITKVADAGIHNFLWKFDIAGSSSHSILPRPVMFLNHIVHNKHRVEKSITALMLYTDQFFQHIASFLLKNCSQDYGFPELVLDSNQCNTNAILNKLKELNLLGKKIEFLELLFLIYATESD